MSKANNVLFLQLWIFISVANLLYELFFKCIQFRILMNRLFSYNILTVFLIKIALHFKF